MQVQTVLHGSVMAISAIACLHHSDALRLEVKWSREQVYWQFLIRSDLDVLEKDAVNFENASDGF